MALQYNYWTVLSQPKGRRWPCQCVCGKISNVIRFHLFSGKSKSCGCFRAELKKNPQISAPANAILSAYKKSAKNNSRVWALSIEQFLRITQKPCFYCGTIYSNCCLHQSNPKLNWYYNGIDRVDNTKGYTEDNIVACCKYCNIAKRDMSREEFLSWIERVYKHSIARGFSGS